MKKYSIIFLSYLLLFASCQTSQKHVAFGSGKWKETVDLSSTRNFVSSEKTSSTEVTSKSLDQEREVSTVNPVIESENLNSNNFETVNNQLANAEKVIQKSEVSKSIENLSFIEKIAVKRAIKPITKKLKEKKNSVNYNESRLTDEEFIIAFVLLIFLGLFGIHRFYLGYPLYGLLMLFTAGGCGILALIDLVLLVTGGIKRRHYE